MAESGQEAAQLGAREIVSEEGSTWVACESEGELLRWLLGAGRATTTSGVSWKKASHGKNDGSPTWKTTAAEPNDCSRSR